MNKRLALFSLNLCRTMLKSKLLGYQNVSTFLKKQVFFNLSVPELNASISDKSWIAQCYFLKDDLLVFEDLKFKNFEIKAEPLDELHVKAALSSLAKLHAASILAERRLGKSWIDLYPEVLEEGLFVRQGTVYKWFKSSVDVNVAIAEKLGFDHKSVPKVINQIFDKTTPSKRRQNVICHGDLRSHNLMFDDSQPIPKCVLVDFQFLRYVPPMFDVLQLMYLTTRRDFRKKREIEMLKHYHGVLCKTLRNNSDGQVDIPSFSDILEEYEEMRIIGAITAALYHPTILVNGELVAETMTNSDGFADFMYGADRVEFLFKYMERDAVFKDRLVESITELIEISNALLANE